MKVAIGLGSNLGDREAYLNTAVEALGEAVQNITLSSLIETPALLPGGAPEEWNKPFLNAVLIGETTLSARRLLEYLQQIERNLERQKIGTWSPRTIDLDILLLEDP